jgi:ferric-dicitrate binding protein FerR (iron transport regulator)
MNDASHSEAEALRIAQLIAKYVKGTISPAEHDELDRWVEASDDNMLLFEQLTDEQAIQGELQALGATDWQAALEKVKAGIGQRKRKRVSIQSWLIAASLVIILGAAGWFFIRNERVEKPGIIASVPFDKPPGKEVAYLSIDGKGSIDLAKAREGVIAITDASSVLLNNGSLIYTVDTEQAAELANYHTLTTPPGGVYHVSLPDGSRVWLNAGSSLRYPDYFAGSERSVELSGEAYFEVAHREYQPFIVKAGGSTVEVLGTHFNVKAYGEEGAVRTTLLEGSVRLRKGNTMQVLKPGEAGIVDRSSGAIVVLPVEGQEAIGWKEGKFIFAGDTEEEIVRQLSRWYAVDMELKEHWGYHFHATIPRNLSLQKVLKLLEATNNIHFKEEGQKIIVTK